MSNRWTLASLLAASMTIATAAAWSQELTAEVPFPFHANGVAMPPGHYTISRVGTSGFPLIRIANFDVKKGVLAAGRVADDRRNPSPRMTFRCQDSDCVLTQVWGLAYGIDLPSPRPRRSEKAEITNVPAFRKTKAE